MCVTGSDKSNEIMKRLRMLTVMLLLVGLAAKTLATHPSNATSPRVLATQQQFIKYAASPKTSLFDHVATIVGKQISTERGRGGRVAREERRNMKFLSLKASTGASGPLRGHTLMSLMSRSLTHCIQGEESCERARWNI